MSWETGFKRYSKAKIAKKDVIAYKVVGRDNDEYQSYYEKFKYKVNKEYELGRELILVTDDDYYIIDEAFHMYCGKCNISKGYNNHVIDVLTPKLSPITKAPYLIDVYNDVMFRCDEVVAECIIPKGSTYFENEKGEIVSDKVLITDKHMTVSQLPLS